MSAQIHESIQEGAVLIAHLHEAAESEKLLWARALHDEIGGLMVAAIMDLSSARAHMPPLNQLLQRQLERVRITLEAAVDVSRRVVEELRPSILDNFGLFAALKWQFKRAGRDSNATCSESYPDIEPAFESKESTVLFRIAQEALAMLFKRGALRSADMHVLVQDGTLFLKFSDDGTPVMLAGKETGAAIALASMRHRIRSVGGTVDMIRPACGGTVLTAVMPLLN